MANHLFLIGINEYLHKTPLNSCIRDCTDIKDVLTEKYNFDDRNVYEAYDVSATSKNIQDAFKKYIRNLTSDDNLIVYFSGHGDLDCEIDAGYWVPVEAKNYTEYIPNSTIIEYLSKLKCKHVFLISDSCFSNNLLLQGKTKKSDVYFSNPSRWALTSAFNEAKDSDKDSNTLFCEYILDYLRSAEKEFRVSNLIEHVKDKYSSNFFQTPQGGALQVPGHRGGEFIFQPVEGIDKRSFKGYNEFPKMLKFYKGNASFNSLDAVQDRTQRVGYLLYNETDPVFKKTTFYLYLYDGSNQTKTLSLLRKKHPKIFTDKNLVVFITPDRTQRNREIRKRNIHEKFRPISTFYLDEFIKDFCNPKAELEDESKYLNISNFVLPPFKAEHGTLKINELFVAWFNSVEEPIFVIKGTGGIGKTTLAQYLADDLLNTSPGLQVLFIDSVQIKDSLLKNKNTGSLNIYNFYEAQFDVNGSRTNMLSEELFRINLDAGNILLIIDGLDEVISKIPNFNITEFISSISEFSSELCNGKVIITCRSYFWNKSDLSESAFKIIELEPFNTNLAKEFFNISFSNDHRKTEKAMKIADNFRYPTESGSDASIYHPYVLDIVRTLVQNGSEELDLVNTVLDSKFLDAKVKSDYIIYKVCAREQIRVDQIDVDKQIKFFIDFSVKNRGIIKIDELQTGMENSLDQRVSNTHVEAFKSHPLLKASGNLLMFRYDFLIDLFKSIFLSQLITYNDDMEIEITPKFTEVILESCWYGSALINDLTSRQTKWADDEMLLMNEILSQINKQITDTSSRRKLIANIFNLCLNINYRFHGNNIEKNTDLIIALFGTTPNKISNLNIFNINSEKPPRFDFSNKTIEDSYIDNFGNFAKCAFNDQTYFVNTTILNTKMLPKNMPFSKDNFINCSFDSAFDQSFKLSENNQEDNLKSVKTFLQSFFKLFHSSGRLGRQWEDKIIEPRFGGINKINVEYNRFIGILKKHKILVIERELNRNKFEIDEPSKDSVIKFVKDGTVDAVILKLIHELKK